MEGWLGKGPDEVSIVDQKYSRSLSVHPGTSSMISTRRRRPSAGSLLNLLKIPNVASSLRNLKNKFRDGCHEGVGLSKSLYQVSGVSYLCVRLHVVPVFWKPRINKAPHVLLNLPVKAKLTILINMLQTNVAAKTGMKI